LTNRRAGPGPQKRAIEHSGAARQLRPSLATGL
jgi:hypothetical protein